MDFSQEEIEEFKTEAEDLLQDAEQRLLALEQGSNFSDNYDAVFRAFHSIKGASGMLGWDSLQKHMHQIENHFQQLKKINTILAEQCTYFLKSIDIARNLLEDKNFGFTFDYTLPSTAAPDQGNAPVELNPQKPEVKKTVVKNQVKENSNEPIIFTIDDEPMIVELLSDLLMDHDYKVKTFTNPKQAIDSLGTERPALVFTDMSMPQMTGFDVLKAVNKYDPELPVIFVSGNLSRQTIIESMSYGAYGVIDKPFQNEQIIAMAEMAIKRYQSWQLLNKAIDFVLFQFSDLDDFLEKTGRHETRKLMKAEIQSILDARRTLKQTKRK